MRISRYRDDLGSSISSLTGLVKIECAKKKYFFINLWIKLFVLHSFCKINYKIRFFSRFFKQIHQKKLKQSVRATSKISGIPKLGISAKQQARSEARKIWQPYCYTTYLCNNVHLLSQQNICLFNGTKNIFFFFSFTWIYGANKKNNNKKIKFHIFK